MQVKREAVDRAVRLARRRVSTHVTIVYVGHPDFLDKYPIQKFRTRKRVHVTRKPIPKTETADREGLGSRM